MPSRLVSPIVERIPKSARVRGRPADRVAGVGAESGGAEARGDRRGGASGRSRGRPGRVVRIPRVPGDHRAERLVGAERELRHVRLRQHDRSRLEEAPHLEGVVRGERLLERSRSGGGGQAGGVVVVLHDHRHALERPGGVESVRGDPGVRLPGAGGGGRVHGDDRVERGTLPVVGLDPGEVGLDEFGAGEGAGAQSLPDRGEVELDHLGPRRRGRAAGGDRDARRGQQGSRPAAHLPTHRVYRPAGTRRRRGYNPHPMHLREPARLPRPFRRWRGRTWPGSFRFFR